MNAPADDSLPRTKAPKVALIFEGGGMRNAYTAGCVTTLLEERIDVGWVGGISAGSSLTSNYLAGDIQRNIGSMTTIAVDPKYGGWGSFFRGRGYFDSEYIYHTAPITTYENFGPFRFDNVMQSQIPFRIGALKLASDEMVYWGREDMTDVDSMMTRVRASSSLPGLMSPTIIDGEKYVDGALGPSGGIPLDAAEADGFDKFLVIRTRPEGFRREESTRPGLVRRVFRKEPILAEAILARPTRYNATAEKLEEYERQGKALQFFPTDMRINNRERNLDKVLEAYRLGYEQAQRELPRWLEFLQA
ncbi:patatin-like phospholipase family protein [Corynebacterium sp. H78]|uniref:patatin-like phospholipase family protein n=1 Tax=Corynebacterium sp. H78 TaxID=3133417 RepID=UPI0030B29786